MKKKADKPIVWSSSQLLPDNAQEGVIPWADLSRDQRRAFVASFLSEKAILERMKQLKPLRQRNHDAFVAAAIRLYRFSVQHGIPDQPICEGLLKDMFFACFMLGEWDKLSWLIQYGKEHYPNGFMGAETAVSEINLMNEESHLNNLSTTFMLREFSRLSGINLILLVQPIKIVDDEASLPSSPFNLVEVMKLNSLGFPPSPPSVLPKGLPTKSLLDSETLKAWAKYNGERSLESIATSLSRERKRLGLDKLPKKKPTR